MMLLISSAYGREATTRSWARRIFAAATSSIALVILRVFWTPRMRRRMSRSDAISRPLAREALLEVLDGALQRVIGLVGDAPLCGDLLLDLGMVLVHETVQGTLELADAIHGDVVEEAAGAGEEGDHLLGQRHGGGLRLLEQLGHALP